MKFITSCLILLAFFSQYTASACTLDDARDHFSKLNSILQVLNGQMADYTKRSEAPHPGLKAKRTDLLASTAAIRKIFGKEVEKNPSMKPQDEVDPEICVLSNALLQKYVSVLPIKKGTAAPVKEKIPVCTPKSMMKRFGMAIRRQRVLRIAGKINAKERLNYLKLVTEFKNNSKTSPAKACRNLHEYEKALTAEKGDE